jgi:hypothetical protein
MSATGDLRQAIQRSVRQGKLIRLPLLPRRRASPYTVLQLQQVGEIYRLGKSAILAAMWISYRARLRYSRDKATGQLRISTSAAAAYFGVSRPTISRGVRALETAGRIKCHRVPGRVLLVEVLGDNREG